MKDVIKKYLLDIPLVYCHACFLVRKIPKGEAWFEAVVLVWGMQFFSMMLVYSFALYFVEYDKSETDSIIVKLLLIVPPFALNWIYFGNVDRRTALEEEYSWVYATRTKKNAYYPVWCFLGIAFSFALSAIIRVYVWER